MKKIYFFVTILSGYYTDANSQIIAPDTVCVGTTVNFTTAANGTAYTWNFGPTTLSVTPTPPPPTVTQASSLPLTMPSFITMNNDNGNWYSFVTNYSTNDIVRVSYGSSPANMPTLVSLGTFGMTGGVYGGIDVVKDEASGNWYGFAVNATNLLRLEFGSSLANTPTSLIMPFITNFVWPHELAVKKIGTQWVGFVANRNGAISVLHFFPDLNSPPGISNLPIVNYNNPVSFCLYNQNGNWHMLVSDLLGPPGISRLDFGPDLLNPSPVVTNLGNFGLLNIVRTVRIIDGCDQLYAYVVDEYNNVYYLDFANDITNNSPTISTVGAMNTNHVFPYMFNNELRGIVMNNPYISISTVPLQLSPAGTITNYYDPDASHVFNTPGVYEVNLWLDQGSITGPQAYCKPIVVVGSSNALLGPDTVLCGQTAYTLDATGNGNTSTFQWSTGDTTSSITVQQPGTYWVTLSGSGCTGSDTITIDFRDAPDIIVTGPERLCMGDSVKLSTTGAATYAWTPAGFVDQPASATPNVFPDHTTQFVVRGTDSYGCTGSDSLTITVMPLPVVTASAESDSVNCFDAAVKLHATGAATYAWQPAALCDNPNSADPVVLPLATTVFQVTGTDQQGCSNSDSVRISVFKKEVFFVPNAFSPNGDGHNDVFLPRIYCGITLTLFSIYNRYGQKVYSTADAGTGWDGFQKGKKADVGTYFWYIEGKDEKGKTIRRKGDVELLR